MGAQIPPRSTVPAFCIYGNIQSDGRAAVMRLLVKLLCTLVILRHCLWLCARSAAAAVGRTVLGALNAALVLKNPLSAQY